MSSIKKNAVEEIAAWAGKNENKHIFPFIDREKNSYYIDRKSEETYMMEYSFKTIQELKELMEGYLGLSKDSEMLNRLIIEIYESRFRGKEIAEVTDIENSTAGKLSEKADLPEYVYVF